MAQTWRTIGDLTRETAVKAPTIRFYEQIGLLPEPRRTDGSWRVYDEDAVSRLRFIKHARDLGFSVEDVRALLAMADSPERPCGEADRIAQAQLTAVSRKIDQLRQLEQELRRMVNVCSGAAASECRIIDALADGGGNPAETVGSGRTPATARRRPQAGKHAHAARGENSGGLES